MSTIDLSINDCSLTDTQVMSTNTHDDNTNTGVHCEANLYNDKIFTYEGQCLFEGSYTISENTTQSPINVDLTDFETLLDSMSENNAVATLQDNINEFESVLNNFDTTSVVNVDEDLTLKEINNFFDSLTTDIDLNTQGIPDIPNTICNADIEENLIQNACNEKPSETLEINDHIQNNEKSQDTTTHTITETSIKEDNSKDSIDIISILSETSQSADDGYNSSDFEFITEEEAALEGFIVNFRRDIPDTILKNSKSNIKVTRLKKVNSVNKGKKSRQASSDENNNRSGNKYAYLDPGEGPSGMNFSSQVSLTNHSSNDEGNNWAKDSNSYTDLGEGSSGLKISDRPYRPNHVIPEGEGYLDLFRGPYDPVLPLSDIIFMENKSIRPSAMNTQYEGVGFDQQLMARRYQPDSSEEEYEDEAKESAKIILSMYPDDNRRRRSRRQ